MSFLEKQDPNIQAVINQELARQRDKLEMIASENFVSQAVNMQKGILANAIMAVVKMLTLSKHWLSNVQNACLALNMLTYNLILAPKLTLVCILHYCNLATLSWV